MIHLLYSIMPPTSQIINRGNRRNVYTLINSIFPTSLRLITFPRKIVHKKSTKRNYKIFKFLSKGKKKAACMKSSIPPTLKGKYMKAHVMPESINLNLIPSNKNQSMQSSVMNLYLSVHTLQQEKQL